MATMNKTMMTTTTIVTDKAIGGARGTEKAMETDEGEARAKAKDEVAQVVLERAVVLWI